MNINEIKIEEVNLYSGAEVCEIANISVECLHQLVRDGELQYRLGVASRKKILFTDADVSFLLEKLKRTIVDDENIFYLKDIKKKGIPYRVINKFITDNKIGMCKGREGDAILKTDFFKMLEDIKVSPGMTDKRG